MERNSAHRPIYEVFYFPMAERVGFEPTPPFPTLSVFKTELFNRLSTFPSGVSSENRTQDKQSHNLPRCHFANDTMMPDGAAFKMPRRGTAVVSCLGPAPKNGEKRTFPSADAVAKNLPPPRYCLFGGMAGVVGLEPTIRESKSRVLTA